MCFHPIMPENTVSYRVTLRIFMHLVYAAYAAKSFEHFLLTEILAYFILERFRTGLKFHRSPRGICLFMVAHFRPYIRYYAAARARVTTICSRIWYSLVLRLTRLPPDTTLSPIATHLNVFLDIALCVLDRIPNVNIAGVCGEHVIRKSRTTSNRRIV